MNCLVKLYIAIQNQRSCYLVARAVSVTYNKEASNANILQALKLLWWDISCYGLHTHVRVQQLLIALLLECLQGQLKYHKYMHMANLMQH